MTRTSKLSWFEVSVVVLFAIALVTTQASGERKVVALESMAQSLEDLVYEMQANRIYLPDDFTEKLRLGEMD